MESIVVLEKPTPRVPLSDWQRKVSELRQTCDTHRLDALNLRSESKILRSETDFQTNLDTYHNKNRITDRVTELENWKDKFTLIVEAIDKELASMANEKCLTENLIEFLSQNLSMVNGCLTQRDREGADLPIDSAELEIKRELKLLNSLKTMLTKKCQTAWEQMNELTELRCKLILDLEDKNISIAIDTDNLDLDPFDANFVTSKTDAMRYPSSMISYEEWHDHCTLMKLISDSTLEESQKFRESMNVPRERAQNDLKAQNDVTNFELRKRIHETQKIKNELDWQRSDTMKNMEKLRMEIDNLEKALENITNTLKLAETKSENRPKRPGKELCSEDVVDGVEEELIQLRETKNTLKSKFNLAKATYKGLDEQLVGVDKELLNKNLVLTSDLRCLDVRKILSGGKDKAPETQTYQETSN